MELSWLRQRKVTCSWMLATPNNCYHRATFVQPRYAKLLNTTHVKLAMGAPPDAEEPVLLADGQKLKLKQ